MLNARHAIASTGQPPAASVLDAVALGRLAELDPTGEKQLLERVLRAFEASIARLRPQADAARRNGDLATQKLVAHTLKSSAASIGALQVSQRSAQIETAIRQNQVADLDSQWGALDGAIDDALGAIARTLGERA